MIVPGSSDLSHDDVDDTGALTTRLMAVRETDPSAPVTMSDFKPIAAGLSKLLRAADREAGQRVIIRAIGGLVGSLALAMAGFALNYASQAARDHDRLDRVETAAETLTADNNERAVALAGSAARIESSIDRITDSLARIDRRLDTMEARMTSLEQTNGRR